MMRPAASSHSSLVPLKTPRGLHMAFKRGEITVVDSSTNRAGYFGVMLACMLQTRRPAYIEVTHIHTSNEREGGKVKPSPSLSCFVVSCLLHAFLSAPITCEH